MDEKKLLETAEERIKKYRTGEAEFFITDNKNKPLAAIEIHINLVKHEFKLGCNGFLIESLKNKKLQKEYEDRFAELLNYATLPFYWGAYESEKGITEEKRLNRMADWCLKNNIDAKGHPLAWHEVFPKWAEADGLKLMADEEVIKLQEKRIADIVGAFKGKINIFDVINEATVSAGVENAVGRWVKNKGQAYVVSDVINIAHKANPDALLLYNDFNISPDYEKLIKELQQMNTPVNILGLQSHMHKELWPLEKLWNICETYSKFKMPLHFTELTILSGEFKGKDDNDWHKIRTDWITKEEGEKLQFEYGSKLYTLLFSHPAVEAITWWDFSDLNSWQAAPSGLIKKDMSPKPLYNWLMDAFHKKWTTDSLIKTGPDGRVKLNAFYGEYEITAKDALGVEMKARVVFSKNRKNVQKVVMGK